MRQIQLLKYSLVGLAAALIGHGAASAQAPQQPTGPGDATAELTRQANLSPAEQLAQAQTYLAEMERIRDRVRRELEKARQKRDVVKTLCLNDKLNQLDVALRSASERARSLELAVQRGDADLASHEFTILSVLYQRALQLDAEANQCIGKEVVYVEGSAVTMEVDPNLPYEDPSDYPVTIYVVAPPNCASCYR